MKRIGIVIAFGILVSCSLTAAQEPQSPQAPSKPEQAVAPAAGATQNFELSDAEISYAVSTIGRLYNVKVLTQEGLSGKVTSNARNATIETALTIVAAPNSLAWRRFILAVKPTDNVTPRTLAGLIEALDAITYAGMVMQGPQGAKTVVLERDPVQPPISVGSGAPDGSKYTVYYYLYDPRPKQPEAKVAAQPRQAPSTGAMTLSGDANTVIAQYVKWIGGLDPDTRRQVMGAFMREMMNQEGGMMFRGDRGRGGPDNPGDQGDNPRRRGGRGGGRGG